MKLTKSLMVQTNALYQNNDPTSQRSRANGGEKWKKIQKHIWDGMSTVQGDGILIDILRLYKKSRRDHRRQHRVLQKLNMRYLLY